MTRFMCYGCFMEKPKTIPTRLKPGPRPLGDHALTPNERKRRSREKLAADGDAEFMIRLRRSKLELVDFMAINNGVTRSEVITGLLDMAFVKLASAINGAAELQAAGHSEEEVVTKIRQHLGTTNQAKATK